MKQGWVRHGLILLAISAAVRGVTLLAPPFNPDEVIYSVAARELADGGLIFRDVVDSKPPGIFHAYSAIHAVGGGGLGAVHVAYILLVALTGLLLAILGARLATATAGRLAGGLYVVFSAVGPPADFLAANSELLMNLPLVAALLVHVRARESDDAGGHLVAGLLLGMAALVRYHAVVVAPAILVHVLSTPSRRATPLAATGLGIALPSAVLVALYAGTGSLPELLWGLRVGVGYAGSSGTGLLARAVGTALIFVALDVIVVAAAVWAILAPPRRDAAWRLLGVWALVSLVAVGATGRYHLHYYLQVIPPLTVLAAPVLVALARRRPRLGAAATGLVVAEVLGTLTAGYLASQDAHAAEHDRSSRAVATWVRANTGDHDRIFIWGDAVGIYQHAERRLGARYMFSNFLIHGDAAIADDGWPRLVADLGERRPALFIDAAAGPLDGTPGRLEDYPALAFVVARDYQLETVVAGVPIYRRRGR